MSLTPDGARVRISTGVAVDGCKYLGEFFGGSPITKPNAMGYYEIDQVRNLAASAGATNVVLDAEAKGHVVGHGYRCPEPRTE